MFSRNCQYSAFNAISNSWAQPKLKQLVLPSHLRPAMRIRGSLTRYINRCSRQQLQVHILSEYWGRALKHEAIELQLSPRHRVWVREVVLLVNGVPWILARSVVPWQCLKGDWLLLRHLKTRPLGSVLFRKQRSHRGVIKVGRPRIKLRAEVAKLLNMVVDDDFELWARYSCFTKSYSTNQHQSDKKMLVTEYFLPCFLNGCPI